MRRQIFCGLIATLMALPILGAGSAAAVTSVDILCAGSLRLDFAPGLSLSPTPQTITGYATAGTSLVPGFSCTSALNGTTHNDMAYAGGSGPVSGTGTVGCLGVLGVLGSSQGKVDFVWTNGDISTILWQTILDAPVPIVTGSVVSGGLQGSTVTVLGAVPTGLTGNCVAPLKSVGVAGLVLFSR